MGNSAFLHAFVLKSGKKSTPNMMSGMQKAVLILTAVVFKSGLNQLDHRG